MKTLSKAVRKLEHAGEPVPLPFRSFTAAGIGLYRGDLIMVAGPPAIGKSTLALIIGVSSGLPTLYFSADSSTSTQSTRILSMTTGIPLNSIKARLQEDGEAFWESEWVVDALAKAAHIKWNFSSQPTLAELDDEIAIFTEINGEPPALIVIDNATDIAFDDGDEFASLRELNRQLKLTARETKACVIVLHHTSESIPSDPCPPLYAVHGKVNQVPAVVLTVGVPQKGWMTVCAVKNREGNGDRNGHDAVWLQYDPSTMTIRDQDGAPQ